jgi:hypothetical protein
LTGPAGPAGATGVAGPAGATGPAGSANITGTNGYHIKFTAANTGGNSIIQENATGNVSVNVTPSNSYRFYTYQQQLTANGDGQHSIYGYRTRDSQNNGMSYAVNATNTASTGYNFWGDDYTFGVGGWSYNDYVRTGGVIGSEQSGLYWGSLGYRSSGLLNYGVYGNSAYANGAGFAPSSSYAGIGGGFYGDFIGSTSKGTVIGQLNSGELFAVYNDGDTYTNGKNIELAKTQNGSTPIYAVSALESNMYAKGRVQLVSGQALVSFNSDYSFLLAETPIVTVTANGECNGVYIAQVTKTGFLIKELNGGNSSVEISWIAVGTQSDATSREKALEIVNSPSFDRNLEQVLYSDGNLEGSAMGMWWDGTTIQFGKIPAGLNQAPRK